MLFVKQKKSELSSFGKSLYYINYMFLIVCLGNPGKEYEKTRHNVGFILGDGIVDHFNLVKVGSKFKSIVYSGTIGMQKVLLIYPQMFMNCSGEAVQLVSSFYKIPYEKCLIIYDDVDINFGEYRLREKGGSGTHNGMRSIIQTIKTQQFPRLRVGVGPQPDHWELSDFVLSNFSCDELEKLREFFKISLSSIELFIQGDFDKASRTLRQ